MNTALTLTLSISILVNIFILRWAYREHVAKRRYQQETHVLRQALRGIHLDNKSPAMGFDRLIGLLIFFFLLMVIFWWALQ